MAMANITVPIQVNLPDDWIEQIVNRLRNDPESEWVEIVRCKDCKYKNVYRFPPKYDERDYCVKHGKTVDVADFCCWAERRSE